MKVKNVMQLGGVVNATIGLLVYNQLPGRFFQHLDITKTFEYANNINTLLYSSQTPVETKVTVLAGLAVVGAATLGLGYVFADGVSDIITGRHHSLGLEIYYNIFPKERELDKRQIQRFNEILELKL